MNQKKKEQDKSSTIVKPIIANSEETIKPVTIIAETESPELDEPQKVIPQESQTQEEQKTTESAKELKAVWNNKFKKTKHLPIEFYEKIISISKELDCEPNDLMAVINLETAGSFKASAQNTWTKATGLIQFMPKTAKSLGTTIEDLAKMSEVDQLDYVKKYLLNRKKENKIKGKIDATTLYCFIFWPVASKKDDSYVIARDNPQKSNDTYDQNKGLDFNKDKVITRGDLANRVKQFMV